ncbi:MAG TPA: AMP-binding protein [Methylomirabilota bacterium]|nr:AMP-binding protein [Methylomirabilota bacterium]
MASALLTAPARRRPRPAARLNLSEVLLDDQLRRHGDRAAIRRPGGALSYGALASDMGAAAALLVERGVERGDVVALALPDGPRWCATFLAVVRIGAVAASVSLALPKERARQALGRARPRLVITDRPDLADIAPSAGSSELDAAIRARLSDPGPAGTRACDACYLLLTSGSTGPSKWAIHGHGDIPACIATYGRRILRLTPQDTTWSVAALATSYGLGNSLYFPLGAGGAAWIDGETPTPAGLARACREGAVTAAFGVPTFWARVARHAKEGRVARSDLAGISLAVSAGEPLPPAVWRDVRAATGLLLVDGLGSSEATNLYVSHGRGSPAAGSVGWVVPGYSVRIAESREGEPGCGELLVRGPTVMAGYVGDPDASSRALAGGWLHTGDIVRRNPDGALAVVGRVGDRFKAGGLFVDPARVAAALTEDPEIAEAVAVGVPDRTGILRVVAVVVLAEGRIPGGAAATQAVLTRARSRLAAHEVPRAVVVVTALPTTPTGKAHRQEILRLAAAALAREAA